MSATCGPNLILIKGSRRYTGNIRHMVTNHREMRFNLNTLIHLPWDNPLYEEELKAIRNWESRYGVRLIPGTGGRHTILGKKASGSELLLYCLVLPTRASTTFA